MHSYPITKPNPAPHPADHATFALPKKNTPTFVYNKSNLTAIKPDETGTVEARSGDLACLAYDIRLPMKTTAQQLTKIKMHKVAGPSSQPEPVSPNAPRLKPDELARLASINEPVTQEQIEKYYWPLAGMIEDACLKQRNKPFILGICGSVASGKSVAGRLMQCLLQKKRNFSVELVTTDNFLLPQSIIETKNIKKGFPESYDQNRIKQFMTQAVQGKETSYPVYSHLKYDLVMDQENRVSNPDILILEGINTLSCDDIRQHLHASVYIDAQTDHVKQWYMDRFLKLQATAFQDPDSYFHRHYAHLSPEEAIQIAQDKWDNINGPNLAQHIAPSAAQADYKIMKSENHNVVGIFLSGKQIL